MTDAINDNDEVLLRQIHPDFLQDGVPASNRFYPQTNDDGQMSVDRSSMTTAAASHALYVSSGKKSDAVFGVSVGEFGEHDVSVVPDPVEGTEEHPKNDAHALADYRDHSLSKQKVIGKRLKRKAMDRGKLHP